MRNVAKVRLYPTDEQKQALAKAFGSVRWVWNYCLELNNQAYKETGKGISGMQLKKQLLILKRKEETAWLKETYSQCLQQSVLNLSIDRFFPSSKTCNACLNVVESLPLDIRQWECNHCHTQHDRDINAATNIRDEGLRVIAGRINGAGDPRRQPLASGTEATASGGSVRPLVGRKSSVRQLPINEQSTDASTKIVQETGSLRQKAKRLRR
ncbi:MAG: helix-turn-helix domain-containing protein [Cyanobacteria bacterium J06592_8]